MRYYKSLTMPKVIALSDLVTAHQTKTLHSELIDVRETAEFQEVQLKLSRNMPLSSLKESYSELDPSKPYILFCQSGSRALSAASFLETVGFKDLSVSAGGIEALMVEQPSLLLKPKRQLWTVDRQFRFALGVLIALGLLGYAFLSPWFLLIPTLICSGLIFTALIDQCYFRMLIAAMPWNKDTQTQ